MLCLSERLSQKLLRNLWVPKPSLSLSIPFHLFLQFTESVEHLSNALAGLVRSELKPSKITVVFKSDQNFCAGDLIKQFPELSLEFHNTDRCSLGDFYELVFSSQDELLGFTSGNRIVGRSCWRVLIEDLINGSSSAYASQKYLWKQARMSSMDKWLRLHSAPRDFLLHNNNMNGGSADYPTFVMTKENFSDYRGIEFPATDFDQFIAQLFGLELKLKPASSVQAGLEFVQIL